MFNSQQLFYFNQMLLSLRVCRDLTHFRLNKLSRAMLEESNFNFSYVRQLDNVI